MQVPVESLSIFQIVENMLQLRKDFIADGKRIWLGQMLWEGIWASEIPWRMKNDWGAGNVYELTWPSWSCTLWWTNVHCKTLSLL